MNELALKLAELLDITVEAAIKLYPVLRNQYVVYKVTGMFRFWVLLLAITVTVLVIGLWKNKKEMWVDGIERVRFSVYDEEEETKTKKDEVNLYNKQIEAENKKLVKRLIGVGLLVVVAIVLTVIRYVYATDLLMMLDLL